MFPDSERVVFEHNPLSEVICQLRFPTVLSISSSEPAAFQDQIRDRFPYYDREISQEVPAEVLEMIKRLGAGPNVGTSGAHQFVNEDRTETIALANDFVAVTCLDYKDWESFLSSLQLAKSALENHFQPAFYSRIGLRYQNVIDRAALDLIDVEWGDLLKQDFLGLLRPEGTLMPSVTGLRCETTLAIDGVADGFLTIRYGLVGDGLDKFLIDTDLYVGERRDLSDVESILAAFNKLDGDLFRWAIEPRLAEALRPTSPA